MVIYSLFYLKENNIFFNIFQKTIQIISKNIQIDKIFKKFKSLNSLDYYLDLDELIFINESKEIVKTEGKEIVEYFIWMRENIKLQFDSKESDIDSDYISEDNIDYEKIFKIQIKDGSVEEIFVVLEDIYKQLEDCYHFEIQLQISWEVQTFPLATTTW